MMRRRHNGRQHPRVGMGGGQARLWLVAGVQHVRVAAAVLLTAGLVMIGSAGPAVAQQPGLDLPPHPGVFTAVNVPVYADPVDGWACHWFSECRTEDRTAADPEAVWFSSAVRERVEIDCRFGAYYKISQGERGGWVAQSAVASDYRQQVCDIFQWWL